MRYLPHLTAIAATMLILFAVNNLIDDNASLKQTNADQAAAIGQLNTSVKALASSNADSLAKLQALAAYSDRVQLDAIQSAKNYDSAKASLERELADLHEKLTTETANNDETDICSLSLMPASVIRLLKRPASSYYDNRN
ncbi:MAG: hypothetical protein ACRC1W_00255 [Shewanella sp.]